MHRKSHNSKRKYNFKKILLFSFSSSEQLFQCIEKIYKNKTTSEIKSELYKIGGAYLLLIHADARQTTIILNSTESIGRVPCSCSHYFYILEHGKNICGKNAVKSIGKALAKDS